MILKASQRANGADLAVHLMNAFDNEQVELAQLCGTVADDLAGAFAEIEAIARGTRAQNYLYSLSLNPPAPLTRAQYDEAIAAIEQRLGLAGQPRAVVFHVKDGREHCHVVWSKIDAESMKAIHMAHDHRKLMDIACDLCRKFDLAMPPGLKAWEQQNRRIDEDKLEPSLAEKAQAEQSGLSPEQRRAEITACYEQSDNAEAFRTALEQQGYVLARGDRRGFVVVDRFEGVHSLSRYVKGHSAKAIKARLAPLRPEDLPGVEEAKKLVRQRRQAQDEGERERQQKSADEARRKAQERLVKKQEQRRAALRVREERLAARHEAERLALHEAQAAERQGLLFRMQSAVAALIRRTPGLRSVLSRFQKLTQLDPQERHRLEREALDRRHAREGRDIAREKRTLSRLETREKTSLEKSLRRAARQDRKAGRSAGNAAQAATKGRQDFYDQARDQGLWKSRPFEEGELSVDFNDAAEFVEGADKADEEDEDIKPSWTDRAENLKNANPPGKGHKPKPGPKKGPKNGKGKGFGFRRDDD